MCAYPDANVQNAVDADLFFYDDASAWLQKPVRFEALAEKIDRYLLQARRTTKRFNAQAPVQVMIKEAGKSRAAKVDASLVNLSISGACLTLDGVRTKKRQEIALTFNPKKPKRPERKRISPRKPR